MDIAEIFKPVIVDRTIFTLINKRMIDPENHFVEVENGGIYLNREGKKLFLRELDDKIYTKTIEDNSPMSYDTRIKKEISKIYRLVMYGEKYKPYKYT